MGPPPAEEREGEHRLIAASLGLFAAAAYTWGIGEGSLYNGDPAVYGEMVRRMLETGDLFDLRWDQTVLHQRPPLSVWLMALCAKLVGLGELALRLPAALAGGAAVAGTYLLGRRGFGTTAGSIAAASLFATAQLTQFARTATSDLLLCACIVWALYAYLRGMTRPRFLLLFGLFVGFAALAKQVIGLLPLGAVAAHALARGAAPIRWRSLGGAAAVAGAVLLPWYLRQTIVYGGTFWSEHLGYNVASRAGGAVFEETGPLFYFGVLWAKEWPLCLPALGGGIWLAVEAVRERAFVPLLVVGWAAGVLILFSLSSSRFAYYLLPAYPALALLVAALFGRALRELSGFGLRLVVTITAGVVVVTTFRVAGYPRLTRVLDAAPADRVLGRRVEKLARPTDPLLVFYRPPFAARYYAHRPTWHYARNSAEHRVLQKIPLWSKTGALRFVRSKAIGAHLAALPRFFILIRKRDLRALRRMRIIRLQPRGFYLAGNVPLYLVRHDGPLVLLTNLRRFD